MLATSRAFGDAKLKRFGVSAEPDIIRHKITKDNPAAFMVRIFPYFIFLIKIKKERYID